MASWKPQWVCKDITPDIGWLGCPTVDGKILARHYLGQVSQDVHPQEANKTYNFTHPESCNPDSGLRTRFLNSFGHSCNMVHPFELKIVSSILAFDEGALYMGPRVRKHHIYALRGGHVLFLEI